MLPALLPTVLATLSTGPGAAVAVLATAVTYVMTQRKVDARLRIR